MAEQKTTKDTVQTTVTTNGEEEVKFEPVKQIESETFESVKGIKTLDYIIIALLASAGAVGTPTKRIASSSLISFPT